jgi:hypothetical protein
MIRRYETYVKNAYQAANRFQFLFAQRGGSGRKHAKYLNEERLLDLNQKPFWYFEAEAPCIESLNFFFLRRLRILLSVWLLRFLFY